MVSATPVTTFTHSGTVSVVVCPEASSRTAITPIAFCASLPPWLNDRPAAATQPPPRTGGFHLVVHRRAANCRTRIKTNAKANPRTSRRDRQHDEDADDPGRVPAIETTPVHRVQTAVPGEQAVGDCRARQAAHQCVP